MGKINCDIENSLCDFLRVDRFPTLLFIYEGDMYKYSGPFENETLIVDYLDWFLDDGYFEDTNPKRLPLPPLPENSIGIIRNFDQHEFYEKIKTGKWFVEIGAPWCTHSKRLALRWQRLADIFHNTDINIARVDGSCAGRILHHLFVRGFPSLKFFSEGKYYDFEGEPSLKNMLEFVNGAYLQKNAHPIPNPDGDELTVKFFFDYWKPVLSWAKKNVRMTLAIIATSSLLFGLLFNFLFGSSPKTKTTHLEK